MKAAAQSNSKNYVFLPFSKRVENLKIDVAHKIPRAADLEDEDVESYFISCLRKWEDLNLSTHYVNFLRSVTPYSQSLPQIVYHQKTIFDLIVQYAREGDSLSLQPILELLTQFARDLALEFASYIDQTLELLCILVQNNELEVVDWSFHAAAYLFKYLRKILAPRLIHTYDILSPLLGKEKQKSHVTRFTAEALSFLCKTVSYENAIEFTGHVLLDLNDHYTPQYHEGVVILFSRIIQGVDTSIHFKGKAFFEILLRSEIYTLPRSKSVIIPVLISTIHHCTSDSFNELEKLIISKITGEPLLYINLFKATLVTRKGSRVSDYPSFFKAYLQIPNLVSWENIESDLSVLIFEISALLFVYPQISDLMPHTVRIISFLQQGPLHLFFSFVDVVKQLNMQRYDSFIKPSLPKFISSLVSDESQKSLAILESVLDNSVPVPVDVASVSLNHFVYCIERLQIVSPSYEDIISLWSSLMIIISSSLGSDEIYKACLLFLRKLEDVSSESVLLGDICGIVLHLLQRKVSRLFLDSSYYKPILDSLLGVFGFLADSKVFLESIRPFFGTSYDFCSSYTSLMDRLINNLSRGLTSLRAASIDLIIALCKSLQKNEVLQSLSLVKKLSELPFDPSTSRDASVLLRNLSAKSSALEKDTRRVVLHALLGLTITRFTPLWPDLSRTAASIVTKEVEDEFLAIIYSWLSLPSPPSGLLGPTDTAVFVKPDLSLEKLPTLEINTFNCPAISYFETSFDECFSKFASSDNYIIGNLLKTNQEDLSNLPTFRSQALRVLNELPEIASRNINVLDNYLFSLQHGFDLNTEWARPDVYLLLGLYSKFTGIKEFVNRDARKEFFLWALTINDPKVQKLVLDIILLYSEEAITTYEENLRNLLDDKKCRDELITFLFVDYADSKIQDIHRPLLMPVVISILYGKMVSKGYGGQKNQAARRSTILSALGNMQVEDLQILVDIMLRPYNGLEVKLNANNNLEIDTGNIPSLTLRRQIGFLTMTEELLLQISSKLSSVAPKILNAVLYNLVVSDDQISSQEAFENFEVKMAYTVRQLSLKVFLLFLKSCSDVDFKPYNVFIYTAFVVPRLDRFADENTQSVSNLMKIFRCWFENEAYLDSVLEFSSHILTALLNTASHTAVKLPVLLYILDTLNLVITHLQSEESESQLREKILANLVMPNITLIFASLSNILKNPQFCNNNRVMDGSVQALSAVSEYMSLDIDSSPLLNLLVSFLRKPNRLVPSNVKSNILVLLCKLLPTNTKWLHASISQTNDFDTIMHLYTSMVDIKARQHLNDLLKIYSTIDDNLIFSSVFVEEINSISKKRLDEPDFERRLSAFTSFNEKHFSLISDLAWLPVLYNFFFYVQDAEELAIRASASLGIKRFIESITMNDASNQFKIDVFVKFIFPFIKNQMKNKNELIRQEFIGLLSYSIKSLTMVDAISDMQPLLYEGDEEANFFNNILHIQLHRRKRAMKRLVNVCAIGVIRSGNISQIFLPLLENFCLGNDTVQTLLDESVITIGEIIKWAHWNQYQAILKRYVSLLKNNAIDQKVVVRLITAVVSALRPLDDAVASYTNSEMNIEQFDGQKKKCVLASSLPSEERFTEVLTNDFFPTLMLYLHIRDESTVTLRVAIALSIVQLVALLPEEEIVLRLTPVLIDTCHILRSRSLESRDATRKALAAISKFLGPKYFSFIISQLQTSLKRGYQLHVLGYTVHYLLLAIEDVYPYGSIDYCMDSLAQIFVDEIFGEVGVEKDSEDYKSNVKEIKGNKSYDSYEIVARISSFDSLSTLLRPVKNVLFETNVPKSLRKVDELCRRLSLGIVANKQSASQSSLIFCYNVYEFVVKEKETVAALKQQENDGYRSAPNFFLENSKKLIRFTFDVLRGVSNKHKELLTARNMAAFVPLIGESLLSSSEEVQISALRFLVLLLPLKIDQVFSGSSVFTSQAVKYIQNSPSTNTELCQASFKFLASILPYENVKIKESTINYLLERVGTDIQEPDRQGVMFSLVRAVIARKIMTPELYKIIDLIRDMMVTNHTKSTRQTCRHLYYSFLLDYPQGKTRLSKQISFILKNLEYEFAPGRESVMELLHLILNNFSDALLKEYHQGIFIALVMVLANDSEPHCREMSAELIKLVYQRADNENFNLIRQLLSHWTSVEKAGKNLVRVSMQLFGLLFETFGFERMEEVHLFTKVFERVLSTTISHPEEATNEWELNYFGLQSWLKLVLADPKKSCEKEFSKIWESMRYLILFKHAWVRLSVSRLFGHFFAIIGDSNFGKLSLGIDGVVFSLDFVTQISNALQAQLRSPVLSEELGMQVAKNLIFLTRWFNSIRSSDDSPFLEIFRRMRKTLKKQTIEEYSINKKYLMQWFASVIHVFSGEELQPVLSEIIAALYRYTELQEAERKSQQELADLVTESLQVLQEKVGATVFARAYQEVRNAAIEVRRERREKRAIEQVVAPEVASRKKIRKNERKRENRKQKTNHHRMVNSIFKNR
ncbi:U3 snoRNP-associated protein Utp20 [Schizosaccharomyces pombe]|uniref:U3 small nucleolar RNA-associated protein 20 n=1 Tax=Schizosaccharomyces pombe (strain 972 / ATCC 24843) TaxID=284812 RepID=UTP20_SCHPO|nr:putative U3 snoRNP protein Utp20 [Schizosaccharomyces pombe]O60055.1 RecName: Full=U3 small nucleolar RNA-associated protein 20; Short=U3 snoRNA-associated protein 20 [Schizosaccharomyces pombe 972h-]CAA18883.1 U3 snoRNP protein Utp20 (predicted) [Schizosaccharomyces pombe]|eukprot:NP_596713.1 putative U3 snoRNP protein Utp20 [Schizosaccharomyces pombe]